jgi:hypothetical protein
MTDFSHFESMLIKIIKKIRKIKFTKKKIEDQVWKRDNIFTYK